MYFLRSRRQAAIVRAGLWESKHKLPDAVLTFEGAYETIMSLMSLWRSSPETIKSYAIRQIVAVAGDGRLRDASTCSADLRAYLREAPSDKLAAYANECLDEGFENSGLVLQDAINEIGRASSSWWKMGSTAADKD